MKLAERTQEGLAALTAIVLFLVALGGVGTRLAGNHVAAEWITASKKIGSYRMTTTEEVIGKGRSTSLNAQAFTMQMAVDITKKRSSLTYGLNFPGANTDCTFVSDGSALYVHVDPSRRSELHAEWLRSAADAPVGIPGIQFRPDQLVERSGTLLDRVHKHGTQTIDGVTADRYSGTADLSKVTPQLSGRVAVPKEMRSVPVEVLVDDQHLIRQITIDLTLQGLTLRTKLHLHDFGKPVSIAVPSDTTARSGTLAEVATACYPKSLFGEGFIGK